MNRSDAFTLMDECAISGFIEIRGIARDLLAGKPPDCFYRWPYSPSPERYAASVASACYSVRFQCSAQAGWKRPASSMILARAWAASDALGRRWMATAFADTGRRGAVADVRDAAEGLQGDGRGDGPGASIGRRGRYLATRWCEDMALAGLAEIQELAAERTDDAAAGLLRWQRVHVIANTCHRIPFPTGNLLGVNAVSLPRSFKDGWTRTREEGREWCRERSEGLGYAPPRSIGRVLASNPAAW